MAKSDQPAIDSWRSFIKAKAEINRVIFRELRECGLTGAQLGILRVLSESDGPGVKLNDISQRLFVTSGNVTGLIDRLEEAGYLQRAPHSEDRRVTLAVLTPVGKALFENIYPAHIERICNLMAALTPKEQETLSDLLSRLAARAQQM